MPNPPPVAGTRFQQLKIKRIVIEKKGRFIPTMKKEKTPINNDKTEHLDGDVLGNARKFFSKYYEKTARANINSSADNFSCRSRLRAAIQGAQSRTVPDDIFEMEDSDTLYPTCSSSSSTTNGASVADGIRKDWPSYYRERRLQRRRKPSKSLRRRQHTTATSIN